MQRTMTSPKEHNMMPETNPLGNEFYKFSDEDFKRAVLRKLNEIHEHRKMIQYSKKEI